VDGGFGDDVGVKAVAEVDGVDVVAGAKLACADHGTAVSRRLLRHGLVYLGWTHHSRSLYMIVKKTCRNKLTAFMSTANRYSHASPVIVGVLCAA
jgi:hypothetical protein